MDILTFLGKVRMLCLPVLAAVAASTVWGASIGLGPAGPGEEAATTTAQVFSPGALLDGHAHLDSLGRCTACHSAGNKVDRNKCLACHRPLKYRIAARKGFHARDRVRGQSCETCHHDHMGRDAQAIIWPTGDMTRFPHDETGWRLEGAHRPLGCEKCHDKRHIDNKSVLTWIQKNPAATTFLGLPRACSACHFDEHRGSLGSTCADCHDATAWKPAPGFDHAKVWVLEGAHERVPCDRCHPAATDTAYAATAFPAPRAPTFARFRPVEHGRCSSCHKDPHRNRFGPKCMTCHNHDSWRVKLGAEKVAFHQKTDFPLQGRHRTVPCERCHRKDGSGKRHLKPIAHDRCQRCHPNAHPDIPDEEMWSIKCTSCHSLDGYLPVNYSLEDHAQARFPLQDAHLATPCAECHLKKLGKPFEVGPAKPPSSGKLSSLVLSPWRLRAPDKEFSECSSCHESPHRGQFAGRKCIDCHQKATWRLAGTFDHDARTKYPLEGKHASVRCQACHPAETDARGTFFRYTPIEAGDCVACHEDQHFGQFRMIEPKLACSSCHAVEGFKAIRFTHDDPRYSDWPLKGEHGKVQCDKCHHRLALEDDRLVSVYRPTPMACGWCHEDEHEGAYLDANVILAAAGSSGRERLRQSAGGATGSLRATTPPWGLPPAWPGTDTPLTDCSVCHEETGWKRVTFSHEQTGFPLRGRHRPLSCRSCHGQDANPLPLTCVGCHEDVHRGMLGQDCDSCHRETDFDDIAMSLARHAQTGFPLIGKHAMTPCTECHQDVRDLGFGRTPTACVACHDQAPGPGNGKVDHSGFSSRCESCHTPLSWKRAAFVQHDACFPIRQGSHHAGIACNDCHTGTIPPASGTCSQATFSCTGCHGCQASRHQNVNGYECADRKCYQCHPGG